MKSTHSSSGGGGTDAAGTKNGKKVSLVVVLVVDNDIFYGGNSLAKMCPVIVSLDNNDASVVLYLSFPLFCGTRIVLVVE